MPSLLEAGSPRPGTLRLGSAMNGGGERVGAGHARDGRRRARPVGEVVVEGSEDVAARMRPPVMASQVGSHSRGGAIEHDMVDPDGITVTARMGGRPLVREASRPVWFQRRYADNRAATR